MVSTAPAASAFIVLLIFLVIVLALSWSWFLLLLRWINRRTGTGRVVDYTLVLVPTGGRPHDVTVIGAHRLLIGWNVDLDVIGVPLGAARFVHGEHVGLGVWLKLAALHLPAGPDRAARLRPPPRTGRTGANARRNRRN